MSDDELNVSRALADVMARTRYEDLSPPVIEDARRSVLDWLGSCLAGAVEPPSRMVHRVVAGWGQCDEATVFGAHRASAAAAAFANGVSSHILELDDVHKGSTLHPGAPIIPAALAVAERERADGRAFLLAVTLGYDAALRVGEAVNPSHYRYWHPTGTAATFGAAVATGSLLGLNSAQMLDALGSPGPAQQHTDRSGIDGFDLRKIHLKIFAGQMLQTGFKQCRDGFNGQAAMHHHPLALALDHFASALIISPLAALVFLSESVLIKPSIPLSSICDANVPR